MFKKNGYQDPFQATKQRRKTRIILLILAALFLVAFGLFFYAKSRQTGILVREANPSEYRFLVNGKAATVRQEGSDTLIPLYAGRYRIEIDRSGYLPFIKDIDANPGTITDIRPAFTMVPSVNDTVAQASVDYVRVSPDNKYVYYLGDSRERLYRLDVASHATVPLNREPLDDVVDVEWSTNPDVALVVQPDGVYLRDIPYYDFTTQTLTKVAGSEVHAPVWDPTNAERIAADYYPTSGEKSLVLADKRFATIKRLADISSLTEPLIQWSPDSSYLLLLSRSRDNAANDVWLYTLADGSFKAITQGGGFVNASFSPDGQKILLERINDAGRSYDSQYVYLVSNDSTVKAPSVGEIGQTAWKDSESYYQTDGAQTVIYYRLDGSSERIPVTLPDDSPIEGLHYLANSKQLVAYSKKSVYLIELDKS